MKIFLLLFLLLFTPLLSQTYMNVLFTDASYKNADINDVTEITFNSAGTEMTTTLTSGSSTDQLSDITQITFDASPKGGGLPVELIRFDAKMEKGLVMLSWQTATEINNYGFEINRKFLSKNSEWENIGFVEGHGNSNSIKNYSFVDNSVNKKSFEYRLKQIDIDGKFKYSQIVTLKQSQIAKYELKQNYPNPFNPNTEIYYSLPKAGVITLKIYNILGERVTTLVNEFKEAGEYSAQFNTNTNLPSGVYITRMESGSYSKIIKMILLK